MIWATVSSWSCFCWLYRASSSLASKNIINLISVLTIWWCPCVESDRMWSTGEGNGKPLQYSCLENPMNSMKRQNDRILKEKLPKSVGAQYATGDQWRNNSRKNEGVEPKQKQYPVVDMTGDRSKVWCCKEQYCIGTWNVRSMNQGKLDVVKQVMARGNIDILGISELKWTGMGEFNSGDHFICYRGQESLRRNGIALIINKGVWNAVLGVESQKWQNDLGLFLRQTIQDHSNPSLCPIH